MTHLNILKLCVGAESVEDLAQWQDSHRGQWPQGRARHVTRMWPKREDEVLALEEGHEVYVEDRDVPSLGGKHHAARHFKSYKGVCLVDCKGWEWELTTIISRLFMIVKSASGRSRSRRRRRRWPRTRGRGGTDDGRP